MLTVISDEADIETGTSTIYNFAAAYDETDNLVVQAMPGDITQTTTYTRTGATTGLAYSTVDEEGETVPLIAWAQETDLFGRVTAEYTPSAGISPEDVSEYNRTYSYDLAG
ncbi:hypothetical protein [Demequina sp. NBRC 110054]|uniref:hypothetical protein n=1 Tax=Demequina sp. NBRC 110054 TaxID=1570343 RepID=UPI000A07741E|nr:hypothetical protein [Demequina sp. NBRC 110054]